MKPIHILLFVAIILSPIMLSAQKIGVMWYTKSSMSDRVYKGFSEHFAKLAPNVDIEKHPALTTLDEVDKIYKQFSGEKDAIIFLRSHGADYLQDHPISIPGFIGAANDPVQLGIVPAIDTPPGKNITGVTYFLPHELQMKVFSTMIPNIKKIGLMLEEGHPGTPIDRANTQAACKKYGIEYHESVCKTEDQLAGGVKKLLDQGVDLIIIANPNLVTDNTGIIIEAAGTTPVVSYAETSIRKGALGGLVPSDEKLGMLLANAVFKVVVEKVPITDVPIQYDQEPNLLINKEALKRYHIEVPLDLLKTTKFVE